MIRLELPYDIRLVPGTAYWLSDIAEKYGVSARRAASLCFVVETALENRVQNATEEAAFFTVTLEEHSDTVSVSITDKGVPYVLSEKQKEILQAGLVSSFSFEQLAIQGQRVRFDVTKEPQSDPEPPMTEAKEETLLDKEIRCRTTGTDDEDILRAIRIIYSAYGFRYFHQDIYHHDYFRAALLSGKFVSVLAENAHGQTLGHAALDEHDWFPGIPEVCILVVKEFARGVRASEQLVNATVEAGLSRNFEGVHAIPVLQHPISQKLFNKQGFTPSGFYFHMCLLYSGISREDAAICVTILNRDRLHSLYLPSECEDFVRRVFETAGAVYEVLPEGESPRSELESCYRLDTINRSLEIRIDNVGQDFAGSLAALELPKDINTTEVVMVYLNMNDPGCPSAYRYFRERGFIFTGCLPGGTAGDYLLLEHLKGFPIIQELMVLEPNYQEMLDQIMEMAEDDREQ